jgi:hypothetical protein
MNRSDFYIDCACGKQLAVAANQAGAEVLCACGRSVLVPSLSQLRRDAGLGAYAQGIAERVARAVEAGDVDRLNGCVECGQPTNGVLLGTIVCEQVHRRGERSVLGVRMLLVLLNPFFLLIHMVFFRDPQNEEFGRDVSTPLDLPCCERCRPLKVPRLLTGLSVAIRLTLIAAGLVLIVTHRQFGAASLGIWLLIIGGILWTIQVLIASLRQRRLKQWARTIPIYQELFVEYPAAEIVLR